MPRWEYFNVCHAEVINKNSQQVMTIKTTTKKNQKFNRKVREERVEAI